MGKKEEGGEGEGDESITTAFLGLGWTLVGLYLIIVFVACCFLVISFLKREWDKRPPFIRGLFYAFHTLIICFSLTRLWDVLGELVVDDEEIDTSFGVTLVPIGIMFFISAFSCISMKSIYALFAFRPRLLKGLTGSFLFINALMWVYTIATLIAFFAAFDWPKEEEESGEKTKRSLLFVKGTGEADIIASNPHLKLLAEINILILSSCLVLLAISNIILMSLSIFFVVQSSKKAHQSHKKWRLVKLAAVYTLLSAFFLVRAIVLFIQVFSAAHSIDDHKRLILYYLVPDIAPTFILFFLDWSQLSSLISSSGGSGSGSGNSCLKESRASASNSAYASGSASASATISTTASPSPAPHQSHSVSSDSGPSSV